MKTFRDLIFQGTPRRLAEAANCTFAFYSLTDILLPEAKIVKGEGVAERI
jgi:hypothetical protein